MQIRLGWFRAARPVCARPAGTGRIRRKRAPGISSCAPAGRSRSAPSTRHSSGWRRAVCWRIGEPTAERGGRRKKHFEATAARCARVESGLRRVHRHDGRSRTTAEGTPMKRLALLLIRVTTPAVDREWVVRPHARAGTPASSRRTARGRPVRWPHAEMWRVLIRSLATSAGGSSIEGRSETESTRRRPAGESDGKRHCRSSLRRPSLGVASSSR